MHKDLNARIQIPNSEFRTQIQISDFRIQNSKFQMAQTSFVCEQVAQKESVLNPSHTAELKQQLLNQSYPRVSTMPFTQPIS